MLGQNRSNTKPICCRLLKQSIIVLGALRKFDSVLSFDETKILIRLIELVPTSRDYLKIPRTRLPGSTSMYVEYIYCTVSRF